MCFASLLASPKRSSLLRQFATHTTVALGFCLISIAPIHADETGTLMDTIEIPNRSSVVTGEVISNSTESAQQESSSAQLPENWSYVEYEFGTSTVREFRNGDQLMYVEIMKDNGPSYVIDYSAAQKAKPRRQRSGLIVSRW